MFRTSITAQISGSCIRKRVLRISHDCHVYSLW